MTTYVHCDERIKRATESFSSRAKNGKGICGFTEYLVKSCANLSISTATIAAGWAVLKGHIIALEPFSNHDGDVWCKQLAKLIRYIYQGLMFIEHGKCLYKNDPKCPKEFGTNPITNPKTSALSVCSGMSKDDFNDFEKRENCIFKQIYLKEETQRSNKALFTTKTSVMKSVQKSHQLIVDFIDEIELHHRNIWNDFTSFLKDHRCKCDIANNMILVNRVQFKLEEAMIELVTRSVPIEWDSIDWDNFIKKPNMTESRVDIMKKKRMSSTHALHPKGKSRGTGNESSEDEVAKQKQKKEIQRRKDKSRILDSDSDSQSSSKVKQFDTQSENYGDTNTHPATQSVDQNNNEHLDFHQHDDRSIFHLKSNNLPSNLNNESSGIYETGPNEKSSENLIGDLYIDIIEQSFHQKTTDFRCISIREGCHLMSVFATRTSKKSIHQLDYPNLSLMQSGQFFGHKIQTMISKVQGSKVPCRPRIGLIQLIISDKKDTTTFKIANEYENEEGTERFILLVLVLKGLLTIENKLLRRGNWEYFKPSQENPIVLPPNSSILLYTFFIVDPMNELIDGFDTETIQSGFQKSGILFRSNPLRNSDALTETRLYPVLNDSFDCASQDKRKSLIHAISNFLGRKDTIKFDDIESCIDFLYKSIPLLLDRQINSAVIKKIETVIQKKYGVDFQLTIIINSPTGFENVAGKARRSDSSNHCILYHCNMNHPTIASFMINSNWHFILMEQDGIIGESKYIPFRGQTLLSELNPYCARHSFVDHPKKSHKTIPSAGVVVTVMDPHPDPISIQEKLCMTEEEKKILTELNYPIQRSENGLKVGDQIQICQKDVESVTKSQCLGDNTLNVFLLG